MDATDQQARWAETIKDLKEAESFLAPFEVVKPFYRMCDRSHVWKIRFQDGRIGWGRIDHNYYQAKPTYYVPADLARDATIRWLIASGVKQEDAESPDWYSLAATHRELILSVTPDQWERLAAEVKLVIDHNFEPEFPTW